MSYPHRARNSRVRLTPSLSFLLVLVVAGLFVLTSAFFWGLSNDFEIARSDGFDPLRYEYFARSDLPEFLAESSSYSIVFFMQALYEVLPQYFGFIAVVGLCMVVVLLSDNDHILRAALLSPIAFFYVAQTGKDGLAVIAIAIAGLLGTRSFWQVRLIPLLAVLCLALFIRPTLGVVLIPTYVLFRYGLKAATWCSLGLVGVFAMTADLVDALALLDSAVSNEESGALAQAGRELTFGYAPIPVVGRFLLYFSSLLVQPFGSIVKILSGADNFVIFESACQIAFLIAVLRLRIFKEFMKNSLPFAILLAGTAPFYHFRYLAVIYPTVFCYSLLRQALREKRAAVARAVPFANATESNKS